VSASTPTFEELDSGAIPGSNAVQPVGSTHSPTGRLDPQSNPSARPSRTRALRFQVCRGSRRPPESISEGFCTCCACLRCCSSRRCWEVATHPQSLPILAPTTGGAAAHRSRRLRRAPRGAGFRCPMQSRRRYDSAGTSGSRTCFPHVSGAPPASLSGRRCGPHGGLEPRPAGVATADRRRRCVQGACGELPTTVATSTDAGPDSPCIV